MPPPSYPVQVRGTVYPNVKAAALALGVTPGTVRKSIHRGTADTLGLGPQGPRQARGGQTPRPITLAGHCWPSRAALARDLGLCPSQIARTLNRGTAQDRARLAERAYRWLLAQNLAAPIFLGIAS